MEQLRQTYLEFLQGLTPIGINIFMDKVKTLKENKEESYFKTIGKLINEEIPKEFLSIFQDEEFIKVFYLEGQAKYIKNKLNLSYEVKLLKTLVYCYNDNQREFNKKEDERILKEKLLKEGFKEQEIFISKEDMLKDNYKELEEKFINENLKPLHNKKVICVLDINKIGIMGSFDKKERVEGKLIYNNNNLYLMPKRCSKRGYLIKNKFYYKEVKLE